jgi:transcriptional regulator with XRE-family HTH domain
MMGHIMKLTPRPTPVGLRIKSLRLEQGLSQYDLAVRSAISPTTVHKVESGKTQSPGIETLQQLARGLNIPLDELTGAPALLGNNPVADWQERALLEIAPDTPAPLSRYLLTIFNQMNKVGREYTISSIQGQIESKRGRRGHNGLDGEQADEGDEVGREDGERERC